MSDTELMVRAAGLRTGRTPFVLATVVRAQRPTSAKPGDRALVLPDGSMEGFVGGGCAESTVRTEGLRLLAAGESVLLRITPEADSAAADDGVLTAAADDGVLTVGNPCLSGGALDIFLEAMLPPVLVHVYGDTPVGRALVEVGRALGYDARLSESGVPLPPDLAAVVVAAHGHDEEPVLASALRAEIPYIGLIASRRRGVAVLSNVDIPDRLRGNVHTPAGLDIGARGAGEIALSVYAEIVSGRPRREPVAALVGPAEHCCAHG
ncbi:MAG TPA: XdhC family protein [Pseudonocardiaceae bacterium]|jgi:xanthine dehydrogenase accessory factor|nr:XdhC family protein [Pseudonocardiaceae bacterium]